MNKKEFFERTNIQLSDAEYNKVESMYCDAGDMDKDQFCQDYKKHHDSILIHEFYSKSVNLEKELDNYVDRISSLGIFLVDQAEKCSSLDLREKAISIIGIEKYLSIKLAKGYNLWELDRKAMIDILNNK